MLFVLTESPGSARWLSFEESSWLTDQLERERAGKSDRPSSTLLSALSHPRVWHLAAVYFLLVVGAYGFEFWIPAIVKSVNKGAISGPRSFRRPSIVAVVQVISQHSTDRERRWHVALTMFVSSAASSSAPGFSSQADSRGACVAWADWSAQGPFWPFLPPSCRARLPRGSR